MIVPPAPDPWRRGGRRAAAASARRSHPPFQSARPPATDPRYADTKVKHRLAVPWQPNVGLRRSR